MTHAIAVGVLRLLLTNGVVGGIVAALVGLIMIVAGGMSVAPEAGQANSKNGCTVSVVGAVVAIACYVLAWTAF